LWEHRNRLCFFFEEGIESTAAVPDANYSSKSILESHQKCKNLWFAHDAQWMNQRQKTSSKGFAKKCWICKKGNSWKITMKHHSIRVSFLFLFSLKTLFSLFMSLVHSFVRLFHDPYFERKKFVINCALLHSSCWIIHLISFMSLFVSLIIHYTALFASVICRSLRNVHLLFSSVSFHSFSSKIHLFIHILHDWLKAIFDRRDKCKDSSHSRHSFLLGIIGIHPHFIWAIEYQSKRQC
jgi:uncharacterized membrane protein YqjE